MFSLVNHERKFDSIYSCLKLKMLLSLCTVNSAAGCLFIQAERRLSLIVLYWSMFRWVRF